MRGYKINDEGLIEEVYKVAPEGSKDKYNGASGVYTETAINKLVAQNIRYREFIELKSEKRRLDIDLQDTQEELTRLISENRKTKDQVEELKTTLRNKQEKSDKLHRDIAEIKKGIDLVIGGAL